MNWWRSTGCTLAVAALAIAAQLALAGCSGSALDPRASTTSSTTRPPTPAAAAPTLEDLCGIGRTNLGDLIKPEEPFFDAAQNLWVTLGGTVLGCFETVLPSQRRRLLVFSTAIGDRSGILVPDFAASDVRHIAAPYLGWVRTEFDAGRLVDATTPFPASSRNHLIVAFMADGTCRAVIRLALPWGPALEPIAALTAAESSRLFEFAVDSASTALRATRATADTVDVTLTGPGGSTELRFRAGTLTLDGDKGPEPLPPASFCPESLVQRLREQLRPS